jgi:hypothetical protein
MNPISFQKEREQNWDNNIHNPKMFNKFFGLRKGKRTTQQNIEEETKVLRSNHLFKFVYSEDFVPSYLQHMPRTHRTKRKKNTSSDVEGFIPSSYEGDIDRSFTFTEDRDSKDSFSPYQVSQNRYYYNSSFNPSPHFKFPDKGGSTLYPIKKTNKIGKKIRLDFERENYESGRASRFTKISSDFNFSPVGVIFKANSLCYRKYKKYKIKNSKEETLRIFNHFLTVKGCKLLVSYWLKPIITYVFEEPFKNMREKRRKNRERMKKKAEKVTKLQRKSQYLAADSGVSEDPSEGISSPKRIGSESQGQDHGLLFTEDVSSQISKVFTMGIKVEKPEFNINDYENNCQILFASDKECFITVSSEFLQYDLFEQDSKKNIKCGFSELQMFTVPPSINTENRIFWLEDTLTQPFLAPSDTCLSDDLSEGDTDSNDVTSEEEIDKSIFDNFLDADPAKLEKASQKVMSRRGYSVQGSVTSKKKITQSKRNSRSELKHQFSEKDKLNHIHRSASKLRDIEKGNQTPKKNRIDLDSADVNFSSH